jgi:acyl transferase domain-containing protein
MQIRDPQFVYVSNVKARAIRSAVGNATDLADNIAHGVRWHDAVEEQQCSKYHLGSQPKERRWTIVRLLPAAGGCAGDG